MLNVSSSLRHKKEISSSQYFRKTRSEFAAAESCHVSQLFHSIRRRGTPEILQHHRVRPRRAPYCFLRPYYQGRGEWLFKAKNAERGDTLERFSISAAASQLKCLRSSLSAAAHQPAKRSTALCTARSDTSLGFGSVSQSFASLQPSFSLTYLRHSVSAQAD